MLSQTIRRIAIFVLSVTLVAGIGLRSLQAGGMDTMTVASTVDMPMHGKCNGCAGQEKSIAPTACFTFCSTVAVVSLRLAAYNPTPAETLAPSNVLAAVGLTAPPDPYPPKPASMS